MPRGARAAAKPAVRAAKPRETLARHRPGPAATRAPAMLRRRPNTERPPPRPRTQRPPRRRGARGAPGAATVRPVAGVADAAAPGHGSFGQRRADTRCPVRTTWRATPILAPPPRFRMWARERSPTRPRSHGGLARASAARTGSTSHRPVARLRSRAQSSGQGHTRRPRRGARTAAGPGAPYKGQRPQRPCRGRSPPRMRPDTGGATRAHLPRRGAEGHILPRRRRGRAATGASTSRETEVDRGEKDLQKKRCEHPSARSC